MSAKRLTDQIPMASMAVSEGFARAIPEFQGGEGGGDMDTGAERLSIAPLRLGVSRRMAPGGGLGAYPASSPSET